MENNPEQEVVVKHLRVARSFGKHVLAVSPKDGSALISHEFTIRTEIGVGKILESKITFLPFTRLYKVGKDKIVDDENLLNEDVEKGEWVS